MAINSSDFIDDLLDHQARVNSATDGGDINTLVEDFWALMPPDPIGASEATSQTVYTRPHTWGDGQSFWGFEQWGASLITGTRWDTGDAFWDDGIHVWG
jgi:hypothetical protein